MTKKTKFGKPLCRAIMAVAIMMLSLQAIAYDFSYTHQGKTLFYDITSGSTIKVTYYSSVADSNNYVNGDVVIPSSVEYNGTTYSVTSIGERAFRYCSGLTSVTIPNSVTSIGNLPFWGCSSLTTLNFNATNCQDFEYFYYNDGYYYPFSGTSLTTVNIGDDVQRIPDFFVKDCSGLTSVTIPNSVTSIGGSAFSGCRGLTSVTIGNNVTSIKIYAFLNCSGLTSLSIPNSVTFIGYSAFYGCSNLTSVTVGSSVTSIGDNAFYGCNNLSSITSLAITPPAISSNNVFPSPNICDVTVPCGSIGAYAGSAWNEYFAGRISEELIFELTASANDATFGSVAISAGESCNEKILTATANEGYEFTGWNDGNTENPRTVTVTSDTTFMATFAETVSTPTITVTVNDATMGSASYTLDGNTAVLTATPNEGYEFTGWNDGNTENPRTVTVTSDTAFMAIFTASGSSSLQVVNAREFALYPNPAKNFVTLEFEALEENTLLQILDINGRRVRTLDLKAGQETLRIDLGDLPKGVYTIMLGNITKKLIVE
mgnify:FL=1